MCQCRKAGHLVFTCVSTLQVAGTGSSASRYVVGVARSGSVAIRLSPSRWLGRLLWRISGSSKPGTIPLRCVVLSGGFRLLTEAARAVVELHRSKWSSSRHPNIRMASLEQRRHRSRPVAGLRALVHGHFVVDEVQRVGNRWNIDTGATFVGRNRLTLLHVNAPRIRPWTFDVEEGLMV